MMNKRIRARRKELKFSQDVVASYVGVNRVSVSNWENDENAMPKGSNLLKLADILKVDPDWLLTGNGPMEPKSRKYDPPMGSGKMSDGLEQFKRSANHAIGGFDLWDSDTPLRGDEVALPFYKEIELSAGNGSTLVQEDTSFKLRFAKSTLKKLGVNADDAACVTVSGNSMEPALNNGATVGVDTSKKAIIDGKMYAVDHNGMLRVKMLYRQPNGVKLRSFNIDEHPDEVVDYSDIRIIGRVFWSSNFH